MSVSALLRDEISARGPISFERLIDSALYDPTFGFYAVGGHAGRRGDFITSPEVGPLFGAVVARRLDVWWEELGRPDPFVVADVGAGPGTLGRAIVAAEPELLAALRYVLVEVSEHQRSLHPTSPVFESVATLDRLDPLHVVIANELLDNLPCRVVERTGDDWQEVLIDLTDARESSDSPDRGFREVLQPLDAATVADLHRLAPDAALGSRSPLAGRAAGWIADMQQRCSRLLVFDYGAPTAVLAERSQWLRTYRGHDRGGRILDDLGGQDITYDVPFDQLPAADVLTDQAGWLWSTGIDDLVAEANKTWTERAAIGDLAALRARSAANECEALTDPAGLGAFVAAEWCMEPIPR